MIKRGDVIQVNEKGGIWSGCLMFVDEVKSFGCQAGMVVPNIGLTFVRLNKDQYERMGETVIMPEVEE